MSPYASLFGPRRMKANPSESEAIRDPLGRDSYLWDQEEEQPDLNGQLEAARADWRNDASLNSLFGVNGAFKLEDTVGKQGKNRPGDVFKVQSLLHREGLLDANKTDGPTGFLGIYDHEAIEKFQKENGLKQDGWMGPGGESIKAFQTLYAPVKNQPQQPQPQLPRKDYSLNLFDPKTWAIWDRMDERERNFYEQQAAQPEEQAGQQTDAQSAADAKEPESAERPNYTPNTSKAWLEKQEADRRFDRAIGQLFAHEGGYVNRASDTGGETNYGITADTLAAYHAAYKDQTISKDVDKISKKDARQIYRTMFFDRYRTGEIIDEGLAEHILDITVNPGPARAALWAQQSINTISQKKLGEDGVMGSKTIAALNALSPRDRAKVHNDLMLKRMRHYEAVIAAEPKKEEYRNGWANRVAHFGKYARQ